ncbi:hypothetical protein [Peribacillus frigoritolerans]|uniref:hypothetical protein n=1 Tax=Peribacillus frigoritolerans TaxID=450367 RepID=UPI0025A1655E|nr:hypothetical protein [Peribacillus frigoritolerans]
MKKAPYEQLQGESAKAFEAFRIYRDLGAARGVREVAQKLNKSLTVIGGWSSKYKWVNRAQAFDEHMDKIANQQTELRHKEIKMMESEIIYASYKKIKKGVDAIKPESMTPNELAKWLELAVKLGRLIHGESTEISEVNHSGGVNDKHEHIFSDRLEKYAKVFGWDSITDDQISGEEFD